MIISQPKVLLGILFSLLARRIEKYHCALEASLTITTIKAADSAESILSTNGLRKTFREFAATHTICKILGKKPDPEHGWKETNPSIGNIKGGGSLLLENLFYREQ